ncbi:MAG TPA: hypothetical protein VF384_04680 [Planctomycetota bacterium]
MNDRNTDWGLWNREAVKLMQQHNDAWRKRYQVDDSAFGWDLESAILRFEREDDAVIARFCLVGTLSLDEGTFRWSWANEAITVGAMVGIDAVRQFGERNELVLLTTPEFKAGPAEGLELLAIAARVLNARGTFVDQTADVTAYLALMRFDVVPKGEAPA